MEAKLVRVIEAPPNRSWYFREYEYECIRCGTHFFRHTCNNRINPYCGKCCRENERIKQRERTERKKHELILDELCQIRREMEGVSSGSHWQEYIKMEMLYILDKHIYQNGGTHAKRD